ncbi:unnamed protein product [Caenorhabditis sp. 36 PRJEB53466]|nr:unnamed protein product [Caenorhabditis sp. 36 PRJEB53466]
MDAALLSTPPVPLVPQPPEPPVIKLFKAVLARFSDGPNFFAVYCILFPIFAVAWLITLFRFVNTFLAPKKLSPKGLKNAWIATCISVIFLHLTVVWTATKLMFSTVSVTFEFAALIIIFIFCHVYICSMAILWQNDEYTLDIDHYICVNLIVHSLFLLISILHVIILLCTVSDYFLIFIVVLLATELVFGRCTAHACVCAYHLVKNRNLLVWENGKMTGMLYFVRGEWAFIDKSVTDFVECHTRDWFYYSRNSGGALP